MKAVVVLLLALAGIQTAQGTDIMSEEERFAIASERLGSTDIQFGEPGRSITNPFAAVFGAGFFADASTHYTRRLTMRDPVSSQFAVRCDNVPAGVMAYRAGGGGMVFSLAPNPNQVGSAPRLWKLDPLTCGYTTLYGSSPFGGPVYGASFSPDGRLWFAGPGKLYQVSTLNGEVVQTIDLGATAASTDGDIAFDAAGRFYVAADNRLLRWAQAPVSNPAPGPALDVDLTTLLSGSATIGYVAGLAPVDGSTLMIASYQFDQGGQSTNYRAYHYSTGTGTLAVAPTTFGSNEGLFSVTSYPHVANQVVSMSLQDAGLIDPGDELAWSISVRNDGPQAAINAEFSVFLPPHLRFVPDSEKPGSNRNCESAGGYGAVVRCAYTAGVGQLVSYSLLTQLNPSFLSGRETVYVEITRSPFAANAVAGNNSGRPGYAVPHEPDDAVVSYVVGPSAHLEATMIGTPFAIWQGDQVAYNITVRNTGPSPAIGTTVINNLPTGLAPTSASGSGWICETLGQRVECALTGTLDVSQTATLTVTATGAESGVYQNRCVATSALLDPAPSDTCSAQTVVRAPPGSAPTVTTSVNNDTTCYTQFTGMLGLREITYDLAPSSGIGGTATLVYPEALYVEGAEVACYEEHGDESTRIPMAACSYDQPHPDPEKTGQYLTECPVAAPSSVAYCAWRAYVRAHEPGQYAMDFGFRLFGSPDSVSDTRLRVKVVDQPEYIFGWGFQGRQRPDEPSQNCQFQ